MNIYLDTSLLIPIYIPEVHTEKIFDYMDKVVTKIYISRLTETEFCSALAIKTRIKQLTKKHAALLFAALTEDINLSMYEKIYITDEIIQNAINYLIRYETNLRTLDALHLSCASMVGATLVTADQNLAQAANHFNILTEYIR